METTYVQQSLKTTYNILRLTFGIVPIVAGLDKFTNLLTDWEQYVNPAIAHLLPVSASAFMMIIGVIEIAAGILVLKKTEWGGYVIATWLTVIAITLLAGTPFIDVAVRDLVMAVGAYTFVQIVKIAGASKPEGIDTQKVAFS